MRGISSRNEYERPDWCICKYSLLAENDIADALNTGGFAKNAGRLLSYPSSDNGVGGRGSLR
jgi:hypothetical protein